MGVCVTIGRTVTLDCLGLSWALVLHPRLLEAANSPLSTAIITSSSAWATGVHLARINVLKARVFISIGMLLPVRSLSALTNELVAFLLRSAISEYPFFAWRDFVSELLWLNSLWLGFDGSC